VARWWRKVREKVGIDDRLHDLRPFYASRLIAAGCDVVTVQRALGHSSASITLDTYSHLWPDANDPTRNAAAALGDQALGAAADGLRTEGEKTAYDQGLNGLTANWITRYGELSPGPVFHWLMNTRSSSSVEPGEM
jgi:hypothetical protein